MLSFPAVCYHDTTSACPKYCGHTPDWAQSQGICNSDIKAACFTRSSQAGWLRILTLREAQKERTRHWVFLAAAPPLWNNLPSKIHLVLSLGIFKRSLKIGSLGRPPLTLCHLSLKLGAILS